MAEKKAENRAPKPKMIKGKTSSGLKYQINPAIKDDMRVLMFMTRMSNEDDGVMERSQALFDLLALIFGDQVTAFMNEVASLHGGVADATSVYAELKEIIEAAKLKNS